MNDIADRDLRMRRASDRAARIRTHREETAGDERINRARRNIPEILATRIVVEDGRMVTRFLIDGRRQLGRGGCFWLSCGKPDRSAKEGRS